MSRSTLAEEVVQVSDRYSEVSSWRSLSLVQRRVLLEAMEETPFGVVLLAIVPKSKRLSINGRHQYVEEAIAITLGLAALDLVGVTRRSLQQGCEPVDLLEGELREAVAERRHWWIYEPDEPDEPTVTEAQRIESSLWEPKFYYELYARPAAYDLADAEEGIASIS